MILGKSQNRTGSVDRMIISDLFDSYVKYVLHAGSTDGYRASYPALFDHYFRYWADENNPIIKMTESELAERSAMMRRESRSVEGKIRASGLDINDLQVVLFVGTGSTNGHAFQDNNRFVVWLPVETYSSPLLARVFATHEIIHALHYNASPEFYFDSKEDLRRVSRQLAAEGLATYLTMRILDCDEITALWADYLSEDKAGLWMDEFRSREREIFGYLLENFSSGDPEIMPFVAADPADILRYRAGYYAGLKLIRQIADQNRFGPEELLAIKRGRFERLLAENLRMILSDA